jgi:hypothetical protein
MINSLITAHSKLREASYLDGIKPIDIWFLNVHFADDAIMVYTAPNSLLGHAMAIDRQLTSVAIEEIENIEAYDKSGNPL